MIFIYEIEIFFLVTLALVVAKAAYEIEHQYLHGHGVIFTVGDCFFFTCANSWTSFGLEDHATYLHGLSRNCSLVVTLSKLRFIILICQNSVSEQCVTRCY